MDKPPQQILTGPGLAWTAGFIALDLLLVGEVGEKVAKWLGFDSSLLIPISALICIAAGYQAARRGMWGGTAGSMMTGVEMLGYIVTGHLPTPGTPSALDPLVGVICVLWSAAAGAGLGWFGGWVAEKRGRVVERVT